MWRRHGDSFIEAPGLGRAEADLAGDGNIDANGLVAHGFGKAPAEVFCRLEGARQALDEAAVQDELANVVSDEQQNVEVLRRIGVLAE